MKIYERVLSAPCKRQLETTPRVLIKEKNLYVCACCHYCAAAAQSKIVIKSENIIKANPCCLQHTHAHISNISVTKILCSFVLITHVRPCSVV